MFLHAARLRGQAVKACRQIRWLSSALSLKRRKVLLVGAFNGSDFYGSYASAESEVRTVDSELWAAAAACGRHTRNNAALEMSAPPADPNQWSRASRTDKGVHSMHYLVSCELSVSDDEVQPSRHLPDLVSDLNASLPSDICVLSAARCAKSTVARHSLAGREYTYFVPLAALVRDGDVLAQLQHVASLQDSVLGHSAVTAALRSLAACTQLYTGSHPWHNFTRHKQRSMLAKLRPEHVGLESPPPPSHRSEAGGFDDFSHRADAQFAQPKAWSIATQAFRTVTKCEVGGIELFQIEDGTHIPVVPVFVHGQGFIYNQIRHMMGACIAVCRGLLDESAIHAALTLPRVPPLPLAPPGGLLLTGARWLSKLRTVQNLPAWQDPAAEPQLSQEAALKALERGGDLARLPKLALLHTEHQRAADEFFNARIKPSIARWAQSLQDRAEFERLLAEQAAAGGYVGIAEEGGDGGGPGASDDAHDGRSNDTANSIVDGPRYDLQLAVPEHHSFGHSLGGWLALLDQQLQSGTALEQQALLATRLQAWAAQQQPLQRARNLKAVWRRHCAVASSHPHLQRLWNAELFARGMKQLMLPTNSAAPASAAQLRESIALSGGVGRPPLRPPSVADSSSTDSHTTTGVNGAQDSWRKELSDLEGFLWFAQMPLSEQQELQLQAQTDAHMLFPMAAKNMSVQRSPADACEAAACTARASAIGQAEPLLGLDPAPLGTDAGVFLRSENIPFEILQEAIEEVEGGADSTAQASSPPQSRQAPPEWEDIAPSARIKAARLGEQQLLSPLVRLAQLQKVLPKRLRGALELHACSNAALAEMGEEGIDLLVDATQLQMLDGCWPMFAPPEEYVALAAREGWEKMLQLGTGAQYLKVAQSPRNVKKRAKAARHNKQ